MTTTAEVWKKPSPGRGGVALPPGITEEEARVRAIAEIVSAMAERSRRGETVDLNALKSAACRKYNPYVQARSRIDQLKRLGHSVDKVEFILMGGTFMSLPADYRDYFIRNLHDALSGHTSANIEEAVSYSEHGAVKCIGMTIETGRFLLIFPRLRLRSRRCLICSLPFCRTIRQPLSPPVRQSSPPTLSPPIRHPHSNPPSAIPQSAYPPSSPPIRPARTPPVRLSAIQSANQTSPHTASPPTLNPQSAYPPSAVQSAIRHPSTLNPPIRHPVRQSDQPTHRQSANPQSASPPFLHPSARQSAIPLLQPSVRLSANPQSAYPSVRPTLSPLNPQSATSASFLPVIMTTPLISPPLKATSFQLATTSDWSDWTLTVEAALSTRDLWDHIIGAPPTSASSTAISSASTTDAVTTPDDASLWRRRDQAVRAYILESVARPLLTSIGRLSSTRAMWEYLRDRFVPRGGARRHRLICDSQSARQEGRSIQDFFTMMSTFWHELDSMIPLPCGCVRSLEFQRHLSEGHLHQFLVALRPEFALLAAQLLHQVSLPTLDEALIALLDEETRLRPPLDPSPPPGVDTFECPTRPPRPDDNRRNNRGWGRGRGSSPNPTAAAATDRLQRIEELLLQSPLLQHATSAAHSLSVAPGATVVRVPPTAPWYFDSGASCHLTNDSNTLINCTSKPTHLQVTTADGGSVPIKIHGRLRGLDGAVGPLHVPPSVSSSPSVLSVTSDADLWHRRLGHLCVDRLRSVIRSGALGRVSPSPLFVCMGCRLAKHLALPFSSSASQTTAPFDLVHSDIWGPTPIASHSGYLYYISFIDDFSRCVWVYLLRSRSKILTVYRTFTAMIHIQFGRRIKVFRSDCAQEFLSSTMRDLIHFHDTLHQQSCPHTHEQNGVAERKHRHIIETARALLISASAPHSLWAEAILTAVHFINITPSSTISEVTPYKRLYSRPPTYAPLRTFGCTCFVLLPGPERTKLSARSARCVHLGLSPHHKGYRCYDPVTRRIRISRHVSFLEHEMFFSSTTPQPPPHSIPSTAAPPLTLPLLPPVPTCPRSHIAPPTSLPDHPPTEVSPPTTAPSPAPAPDTAPSDAPTASSHVDPALPRRNPARPRHPLLATTIVLPVELQAFHRTHTWDLVPCPPGVTPVSCKWIFKIKTRPDGSIERHKARLVARGFSQEHDIDYDETFAPVARMTIVRTLLVVAATRDWLLLQMDVTNAFLHGDLAEVVYMAPPPGLSVPTGHVCHLRRALYGLKQAPRAWFERFRTAVLKAGFIER
ncbi:hypothetical protein KSP39_PZI015652 [Platanthera zijinensis]|uniref:Integrase catalytic domain-containing protein n=2 Tax=Magnoliopsida TaxID=3398 RepID=A0AAP0G1J3_9ASPA